MKFKSVRTKLLASFVVVSAIVAIVGVFGMQQQSKIAKNTDKLYKDVTIPIEDLAKTRANALLARMSILNSALSSELDEKQKFEAKYAEYVKLVDAAQKDYQATDMTGREKARDAFNKAWPELQALFEDKVIPLSHANDRAGFEKLRDKVVGPKFDEVMGTIDDLFAIETKAGADLVKQAADTRDGAKTMTTGLIAAAVAIGMGLGFVISKGVSKPLNRSAASLDALAHKDLTSRLEVVSQDEVGRMAASLNEAVESLSGAMATINEHSQSLSVAAEELSAVSTQIGSNAEETSAQSGMVAAAGEEVSQSVATVAAAVEEMTASVREIAKSASDAAQVASQAVGLAASTNDTISKLGDSSAEIGNVVKLITSIAEQTNLLALNATIEAARAGDAGKGFAVVASEVKELANETAKATEEISRKVEAIQTDTREAVESIGRITEIISEINETQSVIAASVEEQAATTTEIGRNVSEAARGTAEISQNITGVASAAESTAEGVGSSQRAVEDLNRMASELKDLVSQFKY